MKTQNFEMTTGAILNDPDNRDIHIVAAVGVKVHPPKNITDLSMFVHENQMSWGTCVGQAEGKGAEYREYKESGVVTRLSKRFIYTQCKLVDGYNGQGTQPRLAAKVLIDKGTPKESLVPDNNSLPYDEYLTVAVTNEILTDASTYRAKGFAFCYNLDDIKTAIDVAGVMNATMQVGAWGVMPVMPEPNNGLHRILFYGYEDGIYNNLPDTKIYYFNSWSEFWGLKGDGWFWYSEYVRYMYDLMVYTDMPNEVIDYTKEQKFLFTRDLSRGMKSSEVMELQKRLSKELDVNGKPCFDATKTKFDNSFGPITQAAVERYQVANHIAGPGNAGYGRCGPKTRAELNRKSIPADLIAALIQVESGGNNYAVGDKHLVDRAFGCLQIRKPVCIDVNKALGTSYKPEDMLGDRNLSIKVYNAYMELYATSKALGRPVTDQDRARIWNGGPTGYKKASTVGYWSLVQKALLGGVTGVPLSEQVVAVANRD